MAVYRRSRRHRFLLFLLALTSVTVITLDFRGGNEGLLSSLKTGARDVLAPVQSVAQTVFEPVGDFLGAITDYGDLESENARLRERLEGLEGDRLRAAGAERERMELLRLLELDFTGDIPSVAARVVASEPTNFGRSVIINRGTDHGVAEGMPVVTSAGVAGRISEAASTRSTVQLITDQGSAVGARLTGTGVNGLIEGRGPGRDLELSFVASQIEVVPGEPVVTSGLQQSAFPPELPIGEVKSVSVPAGAVEARISVTPVVDFGRLEFVKVLQWDGLG